VFPFRNPDSRLGLFPVVGPIRPTATQFAAEGQLTPSKSSDKPLPGPGTCWTAHVGFGGVRRAHFAPFHVSTFHEGFLTGGPDCHFCAWPPEKFADAKTMPHALTRLVPPRRVVRGDIHPERHTYADAR
jgi:hypothetical protein